MAMVRILHYSDLLCLMEEDEGIMQVERELEGGQVEVEDNQQLIRLLMEGREHLDKDMADD